MKNRYKPSVLSALPYRAASRQWLRAIGVIALGGALSGCLASLQDSPTRLYTIDEEATDAKDALYNLGLQYSTSIEPARSAIRNEIIGQRIHAVDVYFAQYNEALTK